MALYLVTCDILQRDPGDYEGLWEFFRSRNALRILSSQWVIVESGFDPEKRLYQSILPCLQPTDGLLITEITRRAHANGLRITDAQFIDLLQSARNV